MLREPAHNRQGGAMLLEGLISILIFAMGILAIVGLHASSTKATTQAKSRVDASLVASQRIGQMWVDQGNLGGYAETDTTVAGLPNGTRTTAILGTQATVTVSWQMPGDDTVHSYQTIAQINTNP
ncbi:MAG: prepilin-type cleavage/methylation domain-containing protein [Candidatus Nitricoxidivorans perseverans]|uniref:Prepilin-type cleavage/methylation domain-containing protein n=1 Tax=Candidatus Nitricoxidivorans perseverans TaxID=2975601 RepID=A0AA49IXZ9_9PROT|nr:MAG: prepilin-type cleavage/methylation domain-containing protein [Candidatus Nitricoxidivorans perseverans]